MERYNLATATKRIYDSGLKVFTMDTLRDILEIKKQSSIFKVVKQLITNGVLEKVERNKYSLKGGEINDFYLANFIYAPSYVSFESALNFYGVLSQFPYGVTSATSRKPVQKSVDNKVFTYAHLQKSLFWGYEKKDGFLIALPEKALLDQLYLAAKGLRKIALDEYDFSLIKGPRLKYYLKKYPQTRPLKKMVGELRKYQT